MNLPENGRVERVEKDGMESEVAEVDGSEVVDEVTVLLRGCHALLESYSHDAGVLIVTATLGRSLVLGKRCGIIHLEGGPLIPREANQRAWDRAEILEKILEK